VPAPPARPAKISVPTIALGPERVVMKPRMMRSAAGACDTSAVMAATPPASKATTRHKFGKVGGRSALPRAA
jgi:hypothetical protein